MKLLNSGVVNHYWPISPTFQIVCISEPDLAHFFLNLRPVFENFDLFENALKFEFIAYAIT